MSDNLHVLPEQIMKATTSGVDNLFNVLTILLWLAAPAALFALYRAVFW